MIYSKANLRVAGVASSDAMHGALNGVRFEPDGSTVAGNGKVMLAVEAVPDEQLRYFPEKAAEQMSPGSGLVMPLDFIQRVIRGMDKGVKGRHATGYAAMSKVKDPARIGFTSVNQKGDPSTNAALPKPERFPDWRSVLRRLWPFREKHTHTAGSGEPWRVCVSRADLLSLLKTIEDCAPGGGPCYLEGKGDSSGVILRTQALDSKQRVIGVISALDVGDNWLKLNDWERQLFSAPLKTKKRSEGVTAQTRRRVAVRKKGGH